MYSVRENPPQDIQKTLEKYDQLTRRLLYARGITTEEEAEYFLKKEWTDPDPYQYTDMEKAARRVADAIIKKETVGIYSDYDCDGIPAAAALYSTLNACGHTNIVYYVPDRNKDGFGLNKTGIRHMIENSVSVLCVLDCGTSDPEKIAELKTTGIDIIIIDHHLPGEKTPEPFALLNPVTEKHPEPRPCAAGVTYLFIRALIQCVQGIPLEKKPKPGWEKWQLDIVSLATLSDMVPLRGINRQIAHYGLQVIRKSPRPGIRALCILLKINQRNITQDDLAYLIVPRINAASRMGDAQTAFTLLTASGMTEAMEAANTLTKLNNRRKTAVASMVRAARKQAENKNTAKKVWVFGDRKWKPSLVGLVAQKLSETYGKTAFVWGQGGDDIPSIKGSCRSSKHDTFAMMREVPDIFEEAGGHRQAGGFTLVPGAELLLEEKLNSTQALKEETVETYYVDGECAVSDILDIMRICGRFAPFGKENETVRVAIPNCRVTKQARFGKNNEHVRYVFTDGTGSVDGVTFFTEKNNIPEEQTHTIIGLTEWDAFRGRPRIRVLNIIR